MKEGYKIQKLDNGNKLIILDNVKIQYDSKDNPLIMTFKEGNREFAFDKENKEWVQWDEKTQDYTGDVRKFNQYQSINNLVKYVDKNNKKINVTKFNEAVNTQKSKKGSIYGLDMTEEYWEDFKERQGSFIDSFYEGGFEKWKEDVLSGKKGAVAEFQQAVNKVIPGYFRGKTNDPDNPYTVDDKFGWITFSVPGFSEGVPVETEVEQEEIVIEDPEVETETESDNELRGDFEGVPANDPRQTDTWFAPDIMNFMGAMTDRINKFKPVQGKVDLTTPGYDLLDPTRQIAANQEQMARYQGMIENLAAPNIALSASLGASGEGFRNVSDAISNVENANVQIANQAQANAAQIQNQETTINQQLRDKFIGESAMYGENLGREKSHQKWRRIGAWNKGWDNYGKDKLIEEVLFPQYTIDNITSDISFTDGRNMVDEDGMIPQTYRPAYGVAGNSTMQPEQFAALKEDARAKGLNEEEIRKYMDYVVSSSRKTNRNERMDMYNVRQGLGFNKGGEIPIYDIYDLFD